jgi:hypothetical protein
MQERTFPAAMLRVIECARCLKSLQQLVENVDSNQVAFIRWRPRNRSILGMNISPTYQRSQEQIQLVSESGDTKRRTFLIAEHRSNHITEQPS